MTLRTLTLLTDTEGAEALGEVLLELGALSVTVEDARAGTPDEEPHWDGARRPWGNSRLSALLPEGHSVETVLRRAALETGLTELPAYELTDVPDADWVRQTQAQFVPIRVTDRLWIVPRWHEPPDPHAVNLRLDPGMAFGTGSHPTTRLCLRWLAAEVRGGETVLDYGCGSGVLAIAAAALGAGRVLGTDLDPQAVAASRENAAGNGVRADFSLPEDLPATIADLTVANILANPLKMLAPLLASRTQRGGRLALSGILEAQTEEMIAAYAPWIPLRVTDREEGWVCLTGERS